MYVPYINWHKPNHHAMSKAAKFTITTIWILFSRSYDAYCTSLHTPDLTNEANPLVSALGMGWTPLLLIIGALTMYVIYTYYLAVFKPKDLLPNEPGYTFSNIVAYTYLGEKAPLTAMLYKLPKSFSWFNQYIGHILTRCLVFAGMVSTTMWLLINHTEFYKPLHSAPMIYTILIGGCILITLQWNWEMYKRYRLQITS